MRPHTLTVEAPAAVVVIPVEGRVRLLSLGTAEDHPGLLDWLLARSEADPDLRALMAAALRFADWLRVTEDRE